MRQNAILGKSLRIEYKIVKSDQNTLRDLQNRRFPVMSFPIGLLKL
jgi:hypothetical protein